ncbi:MAG: adenosylcobinamide-GDP ribazoletransferase [Nitrospinota bacterium]
MSAFGLAVRFLTILPWPVTPGEPKAEDFGRAAARFPFVGLMLGALLVILDAGLGFFFPLPVRSVGVVAALALLSGCLHLGGLAGWADGLGGGESLESGPRIMQGSSCGPLGGAAIGLVLLAKYAALVSLAGPGRWQALLVAPMLARAGMALFLCVLPSARPEEGAVSPFAREVNPAEGFGVAGWTLLLCLVLGGMGGLLAALGCGAAFAGLKRFFLAKLGGSTGGAYGAGGEMLEVLALALCAAWWGS